MQVAASLSHRYLPNSKLEPQIPQLSESSPLPSRVGVAAGIALVATSGAIASIIPAPQHEGQFKLAIAPAATRSRSSPQIQPPQAISAPVLQRSDQIRILESPMLIEPVAKRLQAQIPNLDYATIKENLQITADNNQHLEIRYRSTNPRTVQLVLDQLAQAYVDYSQKCQSNTCQGIEFVESQVPQLQEQVKQLQVKLEQFRQQNQLNNVDAQTQLLTARITEIAAHKAEVSGRILQTHQQYTELQNRLSDPAIALNILSQNPRYQALLRQLESVDQALAIDNSLEVQNPKLQALTAQHQTLLSQLNAEAEQALQQYISNPKSNLKNPIFHQQVYLDLLQQTIVTANYMQVLKTTHQRIVQTEAALKQQRSQLTGVLYDYAGLQQELQVKTQSLQHYLAQLKALKMQSTPQTALQVVSPPELLQNSTPKVLQSAQKHAGTIAAIGILLGVGSVAGQGSVRSAMKRTVLQKLKPAIA